jgi:hypothetical protein
MDVQSKYEQGKYSEYNWRKERNNYQECKMGILKEW